MTPISLIVAVADNNVIGHRGQIPWHISDDLKRFKRLTLGHTVIMGRRTYDSIGRPLPGRRNIVLTRQTPIYGVECFASLDAALKACGEAQVFVMGGAEVYREALPRVSVLQFTHVHQTPAGDTYFPEYDKAEWREVSRDENEGYSFVEYHRALPNR